MDESTDTTDPAKQEFRPGTAEALADILHDMVTNVSALNASRERTFSSSIAYMDRIILLSAGTLTLIFSVVGSIGAHITATDQTAQHSTFVVLACWLLVSTITNGLLCNNTTIKLRHWTEIASASTLVHLQTKLKLLSIPHVTDVAAINAIPPIFEAKKANEKSKICERLMKFFGAVAQLSLAASFFLLAMFIQANLRVMLGVPL